VEEGAKLYGFATKSDIEELSNIIRQLKLEIAILKKDLAAIHITSTKKKK